ncbi:hypothetical protein NL676_022994 [Syzygium grande]|nr:hypothetical protein NL676_022994 [Syzygium grande]
MCAPSLSRSCIFSSISQNLTNVLPENDGGLVEWSRGRRADGTSFPLKRKGRRREGQTRVMVLARRPRRGAKPNSMSTPSPVVITSSAFTSSNIFLQRQRLTEWSAGATIDTTTKNCYGETMPMSRITYPDLSNYAQRTPFHFEDLHREDRHSTAAFALKTDYRFKDLCVGLPIPLLDASAGPCQDPDSTHFTPPGLATCPSSVVASEELQLVIDASMVRTGRKVTLSKPSVHISDGRWAIVMPRDAGFFYQVFELDFLYPSEGIPR